MNQKYARSEGYEFKQILTVGNCSEYSSETYSLFIFDPSEGYKSLTIYGNSGITTNVNWKTIVSQIESVLIDGKTVFKDEKK